MLRSILIIDDNEINRLNLKLLLKEHYEILEAEDCEQAEEAIASHRVDLVVLDLALPPEPDNPEIGLSYLKRLKKENPDIPIVVITGHDERDIGKRARKLGALDFFVKPFHPDEVRETIDQAMGEIWNRLRRQAERELADPSLELIGVSQKMETLRELVRHVAPSPSTVLIRGETGSGKERVARALHATSPRCHGPFVPVHCAALGVENLEIELFGHEKGAFPGAERRRRGWFERASGGTLFLEEVAALPPSLQAKLLPVLEHGMFFRIGGETPLQCDVRLICSTSEDLERLVEDGRMREDFYYRIRVVEIHVPPLREHPEDIPILAEHFLHRKALLCNKKIESIAPQAMEALMAYDWPGNVRELENVIERAIVLSSGNRIEHIPPLRGPLTGGRQKDLLALWFAQLPEEGVDADALLNEFERRLVETALARCHGIKAKAGRWLGFGDRAKDKMRYLTEKHGLKGAET